MVCFRRVSVGLCPAGCGYFKTAVMVYPGSIPGTANLVPSGVVGSVMVLLGGVGYGLAHGCNGFSVVRLHRHRICGLVIHGESGHGLLRRGMVIKTNGG